jgi:hypothetical protein
MITTPGVNGGAAQSITLFCDDFHDEITPGQSYAVNVTAANGLTTNSIVNAGANSMANTRDGSANLAAGMPAGTTLYEEMAWLATQMMATGQTINNEETIQEAIWEMTDAPGNAASPTGAPTGTGAYQSYQNWMWDAEEAVTGHCIGTGCSGTAGSYLTPNYSNWLIVTATGNAGQEIGTGGVQELLAYTGVTTTTNMSGVTPEPASFILIGSGLIAVATLGRRRINRNPKH